MKLKLFVSVEGEARSELIEVDSDGELRVIHDAALRVGLQVPKEAEVFLEENEDFLDSKHTIAKAGIKDQARIHLHRCKKINVTAHYKAKTDERSFSPSTTVAKVHRWAAELLPSDIDKGEHVLQLCDSDKRPEPKVQIGTLTKGGVCALCFDLVPAERIEG
jgi:hypothetical protein